MICSIAPGKIILFGEHFVVRGKPGIALAVDLYAKVCIYEYNGYLIESNQLGFKADLSREVPREARQFKTIHDLVVEETGVKRGFYAKIDSNIPVAAGMGSSAATAVAFTHALLNFYGIEPDLDLVNNIAFEAEKIVHSRPSGIDNTISTYGGTIYYRSGSIKRINVSWPSNMYLVVVDTGIKRNTGEVVRSVLDLYEKYEEVFREIYDAAEKIVEKAKELLMNNVFSELGILMNINQGLLSSINVSLLEIEEIVYRLRELGALGAKLSGAGRGGIVIGLFNEVSVERDRVLRELEKRWRRIYVVKPINEGVKLYDTT